jgi:hypothetical protein
MSSLPGIRSVYISASKGYTRIIVKGGSIFITELDTGETFIRIKPHKTYYVDERGFLGTKLVLKKRTVTRKTTGMP